MEEIKKIEELDKKIDNLNINMGKLTTKIEMQERTMTHLVENLGKLTTYIEKTNENDKKIDALFKKLDYMNEKGTKNCPVNVQRISKLEHELERLQNYILYVAIAVILQFLGVLVHIIDKHINF